MTELDVYCGVNTACIQAAGHAVIVYGDFAVSPGPERRGGPPTSRVLEPGDMLILDFSVVIAGYRSDFTNTLVVGRDPTPDQQRLYDLCVQAMAAGEKELRRGSALAERCTTPCATCSTGPAWRSTFPHHAGHGLGLTHPEAPYFVREADETLLAGDVVTLEPGLYVPGVGGIRIEHNYLITETRLRTSQQSHDRPSLNMRKRFRAFFRAAPRSAAEYAEVQTAYSAAASVSRLG